MGERFTIVPDLLPQSQRFREQKDATAEHHPPIEADQLVLPLDLTLDEVTRRYVEAVLPARAETRPKRHAVWMSGATPWHAL